MLPFDIPQIRQLISDGGRIIDDKIGVCEEAVLVVGTTGAGKSTLLNYLSGAHNLVAKPMGLRKDIQDATGKALTFPADAGFISHTKIPQKGIINSKVYIDCPGFGDTRGLEQEVVNAFYVHKLLQNCKTVKIVLVASIGQIEAERGGRLKHVVDDLSKLVGPFKGPTMLSVSLVVTNTRPDQTVDSLKNDLEEAGTQESDSGLSDFFCGIKKVALFKRPEDGPVPVNDRDDILRVINGTKAKAIPNPGISISVEAVGKLREIVHQEIEQFKRNFEKATEQAIEDISKLSKAGLEELHTEIHDISKDNIVKVIERINDQFGRTGVDFDGVARIIEFVKSIDPTIVEQEQKVLNNSLERLIKDVSKGVDAEIEKRRLEDDRQKAIREAGEAKLRADELESQKAWRTVGIAAVNSLLGLATKGMDKGIDVLVGQVQEKTKTPPATSTSAPANKAPSGPAPTGKPSAAPRTGLTTDALQQLVTKAAELGVKTALGPRGSSDQAGTTGPAPASSSSAGSTDQKDSV